MISPTEPESPTAHPAGPPEYKAHFEDFLKKFKQALGGPSSTKASSRETSDSSAYEEFWQAPSRLWTPRVHHLTEAEVEAIKLEAAQRASLSTASASLRASIHAPQTGFLPVRRKSVAG